MKPRDEHELFMDISSLQDISKPEIDFLETSFFRSNGASPMPHLPTPTEILHQYPNQHQGGIFKFEALSLAVKVGQISFVRLEEAQTMIAIRRIFPDGEVAVPEVSGWRRQGDTVYIYMSLVPGTTLGRAWPSLTKAEKEYICGELSRIVSASRRVKQSTSSRFYHYVD